MPDWKSRAGERAFRANCAKVLSTFARSFGPTAISSNSDQLMSNMAGHIPSRPDRTLMRKSRVLRSASGRIVPAHLCALRRSPGLHPTCRISGRNALGRFHIGVLVFLVEAFLEGLNALGHVAHDARDLAPASEEYKHDGQHDQPMPNTK